MAKSRQEIEQEYQEMLKVSQSLLGDINKLIDDTAKTKSGVNKITEEQNRILKSTLGGIEDISDIENGIHAINQQKLNLSYRYWGAQKDLLGTFEEKLDLSTELLELEGKRLDLIHTINNAAEETTQSINSTIDSMVSGLSNIPIIGGYLEQITSGPVEKLKNSFDNIGNEFVIDFGNALRGNNKDISLAKKGMEAFGIAGKNAMGSITTLLSSSTVLLAGLAIALSLGIKRFKEIDEAAKQFRDTTGLLRSQSEEVMNNIQDVSRDMARLGVSADDVAKAAGSFVTEFEGLEQPSTQVLESMSVLNENFGIGVSESAKLNKIFQNMAGWSSEQAQSLIGTTVQMAKMAGVAPTRVIEDIANNSESAYLFFQGSPKALAKAAVEAAKLGTSIAEAAKVADDLLDFESSITKELELGAMLGANINFNKARQLAYDGDIVGAQQAMIDQVSQLGDINEMTYFQKKQLVEATGMELEQLINQQRIRQRFGKLNQEQLAAVNTLVDAGQEITDISTQDLENQTARLAALKEMQSEVDRMNNELSGIGTAFMDMFAPLGEVLMPVLADVASMLGDVLIPTFKLIGAVLKPIGYIFGVIWNVVGGILKAVTSIFGALVDTVAGPMNEFADIFGTIYDTSREIYDWFESLGAQVTAFFNGIKESIIGLIPDWMQEYIGGTTSINSTVLAKQELESGGSIDDGIVQDGRIVTTNPEDSIIATREPDTLLSRVMDSRSAQSDTIQQAQTQFIQDNTELVKKLDEVISAIGNNKDVYLDKEKVTGVVRKQNEKANGNMFGLNVA